MTIDDYRSCRSTSALQFLASFKLSQLCKHLFSWKILLLRGNQLVFPPARHSGHFPSELHHPALQERLRWGHGVSYETIGKGGCIHKLPAIDCLKSRGPAGTDLVAAFKHFYLYAAAHFNGRPILHGLRQTQTVEYWSAHAHYCSFCAS